MGYPMNYGHRSAFEFGNEGHFNRDITMIDFDQIRGDSLEGQRHAFEQMVCHLARLHMNTGTFRRVEGSGGDGGVEALRILPDATKIGYQAKYYPVRDDISWTKIDESVKTALANHPDLRRYIIAIPCDFTGRRATRSGSSTHGIWGKWDAYVKQWESIAQGCGMRVEFEPWTAFELEAALLRSNAEHLVRYFFDHRVFSRKWMERHLDRTLRELHGRYSPDEHVPTEGLRTYDVIFHRDSVRHDLKEFFDYVRVKASNPQIAAGLDDPSATLEIQAALEDARLEFLGLSDAVDWTAEVRWPVREWKAAWAKFTWLLMDLLQKDPRRVEIEPRAGTTKNVWASENLPAELANLFESEERQNLNDIGEANFGGSWANVLLIEETRAGLFVGRAGAGKSHVLARMVQSAREAGAPVLHILGQHLLDSDPIRSMLQLLDLPGWSFHDVLSALDLVAETANTRALLVIDAINEGRGTEFWRHHLRSFVQEVNRHERVFLIMSCREEYLDYVVPKDLMFCWSPESDQQTFIGRLVRVPVWGFHTIEERELALRRFMDAYGIARPTAPLLDTEFFNPLFMTSVCRSMANAGIKVFPRGLHGARDVFGFVLETKAKALGTPYDGTYRLTSALLSCLDTLAAMMISSRVDYVPLPTAVSVIGVAFAALPLVSGNWLSVLEGCDILRVDVENAANICSWSKPDEVVRFSFQRLQDNLVANHILSLCGPADIEDAFGPQGALGFMVERSIHETGAIEINLNPAWVGVFAALWSAVAETYGKELWDLRSLWGSEGLYYTPDEIQPVFRSSILERRADAFTKRTSAVLDQLWPDDQTEKIEIILANACVPGHAWNADLLSERLFSMSRTDRNLAWSRWFEEDDSPLTDKAVEIAEWANTVHVENADAEVLRLAGLTLTCLLTAANATVHELARKGLEHLRAGFPELISSREAELRALDDPAIQQGLFGSAPEQSQ